MPTVTFLPQNVQGIVEEGLTVLEAAHALSLEIPASCGGKGLCGKCRVRIRKGRVRPDPGHEHVLSPAELRDGWRLACLAPVEEDLVVEVPDMPMHTVRLTEFGRTEVSLDPTVRVAKVEMPAPSLEDQAADMERLSRALGLEISPNTSLPLLRRLPEILRAHEFSVQAVLLGDELLDLAPPDADCPVLGLAVDLGTTTLAAVLCDLGSGEDLATASLTNPQAIHGDDVISRIEYASAGTEACEEMQRLVVEAIQQLVDETVKAAGVGREQIYKAVVAGNTTMHHLLLGLTPEHIGATPFVAVRREGLSVRASELGLRIAPAGRLYAMPNISGYVGGDIVAGLMAHDIPDQQENILYIDIGTNGEMALQTEGQTYACSTAAGPAFEGARISCGMRAATGAVSRVQAREGRLEIGTIEDQPARGICGTGLLDAVAALLDLGVLDPTGRYREAGELPSALDPEVRSRLRDGEDGAEFLLARSPCSTCPEVTLTGRDIRELQLAKGSVAAGFRSMLGLAGLQEEDLDRVILAGAFGSFLRPESACRVGLLPGGVAAENIAFVGNAALAGARAALLSRERREKAERIARRIAYVELSGRPDFQQYFMETMLFPEE